MNNIVNIFQEAPALTDITYNFTSPKTADSIEKSSSFIDNDLNKISINRRQSVSGKIKDTDFTDSHGFAVPSHKSKKVAATLLPIGSGGRVSYIWPHPQSARIIEKRLLAPHNTRSGGSDQDGHPGKVKS